MSEPSTGVPTAAELAACRDVLATLCEVPSPLPPDVPHLAEVLSLAARLLHGVKKSRRQEARRRDEELLDDAAIRTPQANPEAALCTPAAALSRPRNCYICKQPYTRIHGFYDCLCPNCGDFNLARRRQTADLRGRVALVTGGRVKIGFQVVLRLLRAGATVIATTRFPLDAARRYAALADAADWADRLSLHGLDLRHLPAVERFASAVAATQPRLDVLIHNAAQTVRRPPAFYRHLLDGERAGPAGLPPLARGMLGPPVQLPSRQLPFEEEGAGPEAHQPLAVLRTPGDWSWAELTQAPLLPGDGTADAAAFPPGELDADAQQIDLRAQNSWGLPLREVSTIELLEAQAVNCLSPFLLLRDLEPLLRAGPDRDRYVVLVSAVEGQFQARWKGERHPHTNMAKAALNMLTRTCADAYAAERIFLTSVDTGWITNEAAHPVAQRMRGEGFRPPLDADDGAARVLDPVFSGINTGVNLHGVFLKDYRPAAW
jgi:NAD(P)-dependent dehydrogenase (short-subunit alcohol dehydrogenase family)